MADLSSFPIIRKWPATNPDIIQLYSLPTPNGVKVAIALEELGLPYEPHRIEFGPEGVKSPGNWTSAAAATMSLPICAT